MGHPEDSAFLRGTIARRPGPRHEAGGTPRVETSKGFHAGPHPNVRRGTAVLFINLPNSHNRCRVRLLGLFPSAIGLHCQTYILPSSFLGRRGGCVFELTRKSLSTGV